MTDPPDPALAAEALGRPGRVTRVLTGSLARGWLPREQERARGGAGQESSAFLRKPGPCARLQGPCPPPGLPRSSPGSLGPRGPPPCCPRGGPHLASASKAGLLQPGPDALDAPGVLGVAVGVPTGALVFQHQRVVHEACGRGGGGRCQTSPRGPGQLPPPTARSRHSPTVRVPATQGVEGAERPAVRGAGGAGRTKKAGGPPPGLSAVSPVALTSRGLR